MICIGKQATIIQDKGQYANINTFSEDVSVMLQVPILDTMVAYDCPHSD